MSHGNEVILGDTKQDDRAESFDARHPAAWARQAEGGIGEDGKAVAAYKVPHTSYLVVVDADGKVVYTGVGAEQNVKGAIARAIAPKNGMKHDGM